LFISNNSSLGDWFAYLSCLVTLVSVIAAILRKPAVPDLARDLKPA
jgi:hypothetical protein